MKKITLIGLTFLMHFDSAFAADYVIEQNPYTIPRIYGNSWCQVRGPTVSVRFFIGGPNQGDSYSCQIKGSVTDTNNNLTLCQDINNEIATITITHRSNWLSYLSSDFQNCLNSLSENYTFDARIICTNQTDSTVIQARLPTAYCY